MSYQIVDITEEMIIEAKRLESEVRVNRTKASDIDTLTGILGEFAFAQWFYGDWKKHNVGNNKGHPDFERIEIKTSSFPFSNRLNLLVREDYAKARTPDYYVQLIINVKSIRADKIDPGTQVIICGFAFGHEVDESPLRDFGSKYGGAGGYRCHYISVKDLHPIEELRDYYGR